MPVNREELSRTMDVAEWDMLRAHLERGGLIVVDAGLGAGFGINIDSSDKDIALAAEKFRSAC